MQKKIALLIFLASLSTACSPDNQLIQNKVKREKQTPTPTPIPTRTELKFNWATPVPEILETGHTSIISFENDKTEYKTWVLQVIPGESYILNVSRVSWNGQIELAYFGQNSDMLTDSELNILKKTDRKDIETWEFKAQGSNYYLGFKLPEYQEKNGLVNLLVKLEKKFETPAPSLTPNPPSPISPTDPSQPLKIQMTESPSSESNQFEYQLRFSEAPNPDSVAQNLCIRAQSPGPLSIESLASGGLFSLTQGVIMYRLADFQSQWNDAKTELQLKFKPGRGLLRDQDPARQPAYSLSLNCGTSPLTDLYERPRESGFANENAQSLLPKIQLKAPGKALALQLQNAQVIEGKGLKLNMNQSLLLQTQTGPLAGGLSGNASEAFMAIAQIPATEAAKNYWLTQERNGHTVLKRVNWAALGGSVELDRFDPENRSLQLTAPKPRTQVDVIDQGSEVESFPGPFFTDDADGNGESLELELITRGWQAVPLSINLGEKLKNSSEVAQDLQSKLNTALKALPNFQKATDAAFTAQTGKNDLLSLSFDDPSGLYLGFRVSKFFLSSSTQPLPTRWKNNELARKLSAEAFPTLFLPGDLLTIELGENLKAPSGEKLQQRSLSILVGP
jgi:hypothetical protein